MKPRRSLGEAQKKPGKRESRHMISEDMITEETVASAPVEDGYQYIIYGYGSESTLTVVEPGASTEALCDGFTMKSGITGAEFNDMIDVNVQIDGCLVDSSEGLVPGDVWEQIPKE